MSDTLSGGTAVVLHAGGGENAPVVVKLVVTSNFDITAVGRAIATTFAREGCSNLAIGDLDETALGQTEKELKSQFASLQIRSKKLDLNDEKSTAEFFQDVVEKFGRIDFSVNIANHEPAVAGVHELEESDLELAFTENQRSVCTCSIFAQYLESTKMDD